MKLTLRTLGGIAGVSTLLLAARLPVLAQDAAPAKPATAAPDAAPVTLTRTVKPDTTYRYKSKTTATLGGMDVPIKIDMHETIKEVKKTGEIVTELVSDGGTYTLMGEDHDIPMTPPITITEDKNGKVTDYKGDLPAMSLSTPEVIKLQALMQHLLLPTKSVKEKDKWETELDNPAVKNKKVTVKSSYLGTDKVDGVSLWKIKQTAEADSDDSGGKMSAEKTFWLDPADGHLVKSEAKLTGVPTQFGNMDSTTTVEFVKSEPKKEAVAK